MTRGRFRRDYVRRTIILRVSHILHAGIVKSQDIRVGDLFVSRGLVLQLHRHVAGALVVFVGDRLFANLHTVIVD